METAEKRDASTIVTEVIKSLIEKNPEGGEINITALEKQLPNLTRSEIIFQLRKSNAGAFVTGRRGKPSRFIYGPVAINHLHRDDSHNSPARRINSPRKPEGDEIDMSHGIELRVRVGDQVTTIPIKLELGVAA